MCIRLNRSIAIAFATLAPLTACSDPEIEKQPERTAPPIVTSDKSEVVGSARFVDATDEFGLEFVHTSGAVGDKLLPETMGSGACLFDKDGDGDLDLFLVNGRSWDSEHEPTVGRLYELNNGRFTDVTAGSGLEDPAFSIIGQGVSAGDYDGDGDWDLYITALGPNLLLENRNGQFVNVSAKAGVAGGTWSDEDGHEFAEWSTSSAFCDLDADGWLDLFVCNYLEWSEDNDVEFAISNEVMGYPSPKLYRGSSCRLFRNLGDGTFEDVTGSSGIHNVDHKALGVCMADVNRDGRIDLAVANDTQPNCLYLNQGEMRFEDVGPDSGIGYGSNGAVRAGMGIDAAFYSSEHELAIAVGNFSQEPISFFRTIGKDGSLFSDDGIATGLGRSSGPSLTFSTAFLDANHDGYLDLLAINGHIEPDIALISSSTTWRQRPQLFLNRARRGQFVDVTSEAGPAFAASIVGRGLALGDLDGDGDLDAVVTECGGPAHVWKNETATTNASLRLKLTAPGTNVHAIGAEVKVTGGPFPQTTWVRTGAAYLSQHEPILTFGLGEAQSADVEIRWPNGERSTHPNLTVNKQHNLTPN